MNKVLLKKSELIKKFEIVLIFFLYQKKKEQFKKNGQLHIQKQQRCA